MRVLVQDANGLNRADAALPSPLGADNLRGFDVLLLDVDDDGDLDVVFSRSEANESVRNTLVLENPEAD